MATDIVIPQVGESVSEGVISAWLKDDGEHVERDEPVLELETDKISVEVPAPAAGVVKRSAQEGDTVEIGSVVGAIEEGEAPDKGDSGGESKGKKAGASKSESGKAGSGGESKDQSATKTAERDGAKADQTAEPKRQPAVSGDAGGRTDGGVPSARGGDEPAQTGDGASATPLARKLAEDHRVNLSEVVATGASGRIREQDVLAYIQSHAGGSPNGAPAQAAPSGQAAPATKAGSRDTRRERMSPLRQRIAQRLVEAQQTAAMLTTFNECDMTNVMALRSRHKEAFEKAHGVRLGFMSFFVKAAVQALQRFPNVNSYIVDGEKGPEFERHDYCDIAIAVGTEKGLVVPVVRNCESKTFAQIESGINELAAKARDNKLTLEDMQGGTFTISNGGVYGSLLSTPILNPPQSGILGMHNIVKRAVEDPDNPGQVALRPMMYLALSYDHRIVDGEGAVRFLRHIKDCIEDPQRLMLEL